MTPLRTEHKSIYDLDRAEAPRRATGAVDMGGRLGSGPSFKQSLLAAHRGKSGDDPGRGVAGAIDPARDAAAAQGLSAYAPAVGVGADAAENGADPSSASTSAAGAAETVDPQRRAADILRLSAKEMERFAQGTPEQQDAFLKWKEHSRAVRQSAEDFAGFFFGFMMKEMRSTVEQGALGHGGKGETLFQELIDEETGKNVAAGDRTGLVDMLHKSMEGPRPLLGTPEWRRRMYEDAVRRAGAAADADMAG